MGFFCHKKGPRDFFSKIGLGHFFSIYGPLTSCKKLVSKNYEYCCSVSVPKKGTRLFARKVIGLKFFLVVGLKIFSIIGKVFESLTPKVVACSHWLDHRLRTISFFTSSFTDASTLRPRGGHTFTHYTFVGESPSSIYMFTHQPVRFV